MYGIFAYIYHENQPNVGRYTSPMDAMGYIYIYDFRFPHASNAADPRPHNGTEGQQSTEGKKGGGT